MRRAWLIGLAVVVAVIATVLLAIPPKKEPVKVWFVRATNELGVKKLVFEGTNGIPREIEAFANVLTGTVDPTKTPPGPDPVYDWTNATVSAGTNFYFALKAPQKDVPYCVMWQFHDIWSPPTRWGRFRVGCYLFFKDHGMPSLAQRFVSTLHVQSIPSTEFKE